MRSAPSSSSLVSMHRVVYIFLKIITSPLPSLNLRPLRLRRSLPSLLPSVSGMLCSLELGSPRLPRGISEISAILVRNHYSVSRPQINYKLSLYPEHRPRDSFVSELPSYL